MEFIDFKKEVCGLDEKNKQKATVGFIYCVPVESENDPELYELSIDDVLTINKPEIDLIYMTDPYRSEEFIQLSMKFRSSYDPDIKATYEYLKHYEKNVSEFFDDYKMCPAMSVEIVPNNALEKRIHHMELQLPMMISLTSSRQNNLPDTITMLFTVDNCSIHSEEFISTEEVNRELMEEKMEEENERLAIEEEERAKYESLKWVAEMQSSTETANESNVIRVGRAAKHDNEENQ